MRSTPIRRKARRARNPRTNDRVDVPEKNVVTFQPGKEMEEKVRREAKVYEPKRKKPKPSANQKTKPAPAKPAPKPSPGLDLDALSSSLAKSVKSGGARSSAPKGPNRAETATVAREGRSSIAGGAGAVSPQPVLLLIFEDLHWADASSLQLLQFFARELRDAPVGELARLGANLPSARTHAAGCEAEFTRLQLRSDPEQWAALAAAWDAFSGPYQAAYARWRASADGGCYDRTDHCRVPRRR